MTWPGLSVNKKTPKFRGGISGSPCVTVFITVQFLAKRVKLFLIKWLLMAGCFDPLGNGINSDFRCLNNFCFGFRFFGFERAFFRCLFLDCGLGFGGSVFHLFLLGLICPHSSRKRRTYPTTSACRLSSWRPVMNSAVRRGPVPSWSRKFSRSTAQASRAEGSLSRG